MSLTWRHIGHDPDSSWHPNRSPRKEMEAVMIRFHTVRDCREYYFYMKRILFSSFALFILSLGRGLIRQRSDSENRIFPLSERRRRITGEEKFLLVPRIILDHS
ncbi:hypothetical protein CEXT_546781 [Caerostris extrusa]|uniref:Uncharacterized protein n=1 Tax=Caerostris extrusa TaxID=172846 RepID=A0AAV4YB52_CAEEX|nr:hypothetical protein CEXT_546781 [Caerostris extrusa]